MFLSTNSLTKAYGLATLRCGWTLAAPEITGQIRRARDVVDVNGPIPAERLALVAMRHLDALRERARGLIEANRQLFDAFLARHPALHCAPSAATIAFPRFRDGRDAGPFVAGLQNDAGVALVPGSFFELPSHFRISLGGATDALRDGLEAIARRLAADASPREGPGKRRGAFPRRDGWRRHPADRARAAAARTPPRPGDRRPWR